MEELWDRIKTEIVYIFLIVLLMAESISRWREFRRGDEVRVNDLDCVVTGVIDKNTLSVRYFGEDEAVDFAVSVDQIDCGQTSGWEVFKANWRRYFDWCNESYDLHLNADGAALCDDISASAVRKGLRYDYNSEYL